MEIAKRLFRRLSSWDYSWIALLALAVLAMHLSILGVPQEPMFDEQHYVIDARAVVDGSGMLRPEHPPLAQLTIASGIWLFGDNPFGWRVFSVLFGTAGVVLLYLVCEKLGMSRQASLIASFLVAFENLSFVQASIAMLDVYSVTFMLAAFWLYLRRSYAWSGVAICLSTLCKLTGALTLPVIAIHWLVIRRDRPIHFGLSMALAPLLFFQSMPLLDYLATGHFINPVVRITRMLTLSGSITFATTPHPYLSRPWEWIVKPEIMPYWWEPQYVAAVSFTVWALIIPIALIMSHQARKGNEAAVFVMAWFTSVYLVWIPLSIITDRASYIYYFYPTVGAICIGLGWVLFRLMESGRRPIPRMPGWTATAAVWGYLALHAAILVMLSPLLGRWICLYTILSA